MAEKVYERMMRNDGNGWQKREDGRMKRADERVKEEQAEDEGEGSSKGKVKRERGGWG